MADVPLGTQLSGGVDSSWVSVLAAREAPGMKSFTVSFAEPGFDESPAARRVAALADLEYHDLAADPSSFGTALPDIIWHNDEPLTHANSVEIFNLCRFAKRHVKVLLTGEGADELFGGYPRYYLCKLGEAYRRLPAPLRGPGRRLLDALSRGRERKPSAYLGMAPRDLVFWNAAFTRGARAAWLLDRDELELSDRRALLDAVWRNDRALLDNQLTFDFASYLQPILSRQDKMSMGASLEARVPILDNAMVDLAFGIPAAVKLRYLRPKYLFKRAASRDLPRRIVDRRKVGFGVPVGAWLRQGGPLAGHLEAVLDRRHGLGVDPVKLERLADEHRRGLADHQDLLWPLLNYALWQERFFGDGEGGA
jgi:asparagine synthase (glutamine-hydrolysing)